jgi:hypothetical protein
MQVSPIEEDSKRPELLRQNNLAIKKHPTVKQNPVIFRKNCVIRTKSRPKTLSAALNGPKAKICFTDFFSENMKREFLKMGRLDAIEKFTMATPSKTLKKFTAPLAENIADSIKNKLLLRERAKDVNVSRASKSFSVNPGQDFKKIIGICEDTRAQNVKLKKDIKKTTCLMRDQFQKLLRSSSHHSEFF